MPQQARVGLNKYLKQSYNNFRFNGSYRVPVYVFSLPKIKSRFSGFKDSSSGERLSIEKQNHLSPLRLTSVDGKYETCVNVSFAFLLSCAESRRGRVRAQKIAHKSIVFDRVRFEFAPSTSAVTRVLITRSFSSRSMRIFDVYNGRLRVVIVFSTSCRGTFPYRSARVRLANASCKRQQFTRTSYNGQQNSPAAFAREQTYVGCISECGWCGFSGWFKCVYAVVTNLMKITKNVQDPKSAFERTIIPGKRVSRNNCQT